jgi:hypothetical protein
MDLKMTIVTAVLKEALPMMVLDPTKVEMKWIMKALRDYYGLETADSKVIWKSYITKREGSSNKYHYFVVFEANGQYHAANAYGRIGYPAKVFDLGTFRDQYEATDVAKRKWQKKLGDDYKVTEI